MNDFFGVFGNFCNFFHIIFCATFFASLFLDYNLTFLFLGWDYQILEEEEFDTTGKSLNYVEIEIVGENVYQKMLGEAGVHRVARVPNNSNQIHTSTCGVKDAGF